MHYYKNKVLLLILFCLGTLMTFNCNAWGWNHYHGGGGWGYGGPGYYGPGWGGPNVIINVPILPPPPPRVYVRECETVQICNEYDECWLERQCQ